MLAIHLQAGPPACEAQSSLNQSKLQPLQIMCETHVGVANSVPG